MFRPTTDLLNRVAALVEEHREFFAAVREWYADVSLANQAVRVLLARASTGARVAVAVNGQHLAGDAVPVTPGTQSVRWVLPMPPVGVGENEVAVVTDPGGRRLYLRSAAASQDGGLSVQVVELTRRSPEPSAHLAVGAAHDARFDGDVWAVQPGGRVAFRLRLMTRSPVAFVLTLLNEEVTPAAVFDLLKGVAEKVQEVRRRLADERAKLRNDPARAARLDGDLADLDAYLHLHARQVEPAFRGPDGATMRDVIARTGDPGRVVEGAPVEPDPRPRARPVEPPRDDRRRGDRPRRPDRPRATRPPRPEGRGAVSGLSCLAVLAGGALVAAGLGYAGWSLVRPTGDAGGVGDEITARVRAAGGNQSGPLTVSLIWYDKNDLDLHVVCPGGAKVWFQEERAGGGVLEVDRNDNQLNLTDAPVEHVRWEAAPPPGRYRVIVNFFKHNPAEGAPATSRFVVRLQVNGREQLYPGSITHDPAAGMDGHAVLVTEFDIPGN